MNADTAQHSNATRPFPLVVQDYSITSVHVTVM